MIYLTDIAGQHWYL